MRRQGNSTHTAGRRLHHFMLVSHRWLGLIVGPVVVLWCFSGAVMMYVGYPALSEHERRACLPALATEALDTLQWPPALAEVSDASVEQLGDQLVVRARTSEGTVTRPLDGSQLKLDQERLTSLAQAFQQACSQHGEVLSSASIERDQWTVAGGFHRHRPLQKVAFNDPAATELYVSSATGEIVQRTTTRERFWNTPGAVVHWLYFTHSGSIPALGPKSSFGPRSPRFT